MILVTGASGKTGRAVVRALANTGHLVRAFVHRREQIELLIGEGASEVLTGDLLNADHITKAVRGTTAIYHICPNVHPDEFRIGQIVIAAAELAKLQHFVYHSVLHPQTEAMPHHWQKLRVEEQLLKSDLRYTILQPTAYMQNVLAYWDEMVKFGRYSVPYPESTCLSLVDLNDVADVASIVMKNLDHYGATYELVGTGPLSQRALAIIMGEALNRVIEVDSLPLAEWEQTAMDRGLDLYAIDTLLKMFRYYEVYGFVGNPNVLTWLLGRAPNDFLSFCRNTINSL